MLGTDDLALTGTVTHLMHAVIITLLVAVLEVLRRHNKNGGNRR